MPGGSDKANPSARGLIEALIYHVESRYHGTAIRVLGSRITLAQRPLSMADASFKDVPELFEVCASVVVCITCLTSCIVG